MARPAGFKIKHWTDDEWAVVVEKTAAGLKDIDIARLVGRTPSAVNKKRQERFLFKRPYAKEKYG